MALRTLAFCTGLALLAACTAIPAEGSGQATEPPADSPAAPAPEPTAMPANTDTALAPDGQPFTLAPGQRATLADGGALQYVRVVNDSRCPPDVRCVWAGDAVLAFEWAPAGGPSESFELHTGLEPRTQAVGGRTLRLQSLTRDAAPVATLLLEPAR